MGSYDFRSPRLHVSADLVAGAAIAPGEAGAHHLRHVLRLEAGAKVLTFNGRDGEWEARLAYPSKRETKLEILAQTRKQPPPSDLHYAFAPIKHARLDYMVQKAVELGAGRLTPVITRYTQVSRVNTERMRANVIEAAEQCGVLSVPDADEAMDFPGWLASMDKGRLVVFCDEDAEISDPVRALRDAPVGALTLIIGPEGGFEEKERELLLARERVVRLSLGPRILRADTAAIAALSVIQAARGDWR
jgi:16S rRNA (uracil1498-N3)-methyltransferase